MLIYHKIEAKKLKYEEKWLLRSQKISFEGLFFYKLPLLSRGLNSGKV
jgi:hypothetical protein